MQPISPYKISRQYQCCAHASLSPVSTQFFSSFGFGGGGGGGGGGNSTFFPFFPGNNFFFFFVGGGGGGGGGVEVETTPFALYYRAIIFF